MRGRARVDREEAMTRGIWVEKSLPTHERTRRGEAERGRARALEGEGSWVPPTFNAPGRAKHPVTCRANCVTRPHLNPLCEKYLCRHTLMGMHSFQK